MNEEYLTEDTLSGVEQNELAMSDGYEADSNVTDTATISEVLSQALGKEFPDDETALKAVKDTFSYTGEYGKLKPLVDKLGGVEAVIKKMEETNVETPQSPQEIPVVQDTSDLEKTVKTLQQDVFYANNPDYKPYKDIIAAMGDDPSTVVDTDVFKKVYEPLKSRDEADASKSVLNSGSRLGEVSNEYATDFQKAQESGTPEAWTQFAMKHKKGIGIPQE